jgi:tetrapyrrole methylase family protein/MazG family protein
MTVTIAGLGSGRSEHLTVGLMGRLKFAKRIVLQTGEVEAAGYLKEKGIVFETLDSLYESAEDFDALNKSITEAVLKAEDTCFCVLGAPYANTAVKEILAEASRRGMEVEMLPGIGLEEPALCAAASRKAFNGGAAVIKLPASAIEGFQPDTDALVCITEIDTPYIAALVKDKLSSLYGDEKDIGVYDGNTCQKMKLYELDRLPAYRYDTAAVIPPDALTEKERFTFADLVRIMDILRSPGGCPWDREQTHVSLKQYLLEETYEVLEAVDEKDPDKLADELGDVLLQVVFHAVIASEKGEFGVSDITTAICSKLISRHTHIFGDATAKTPRDVMVNWEAVKKAEKGHETYTEVLKDIPKSLPALMRSYKVQKKAANIGFDWDSPLGAIEKIKEEAWELQEEFIRGDKDKMSMEAGDLLFSMVNLLRMLHIQPELALKKTTDKFVSRFEIMEKLAKSRGRDLKGMSLAEMDSLWDEAKKIGHN